jgi:type IV fimbrial biogenesis protein FimT
VSEGTLINCRSTRPEPNVGRLGGVRGFSLIELMVVLIVVAVLVAVAAPSYSVVVLRTKLKSYANSMVASVYLARSEAIKRNAPVRLCISNADGDDCQGGGSWEEGWIVMDPNDTVIRHEQALSAGIVLFEASSIHTMSFQPTGVGMKFLPSGNTPVMTICQQTPPSSIKEEREITVAATGRPRIITTNDGCSP